jgi:TonB family protein
MSRFRLAFTAALAVALAGCALPHKLPDGDAPIPLAPSPVAPPAADAVPVAAMPAREEVIGCVSIRYDVTTAGVPQNVQINESHPPGYFDAEVLRLMDAVRFKARKRAGRGARVFSFVPPNSTSTREQAAALCSPVPKGEEPLNSTNGTS